MKTNHEKPKKEREKRQDEALHVALQETSGLVILQNEQIVQPVESRVCTAG